jgi:putative ABC transport system substrate-binding protein
MRRRKFITLLASATAWPLVARAQQPGMPTIGILYPGAPEATAKYVASLRKGLAEAGYVEGRNVLIEYRWGHGDSGRLPELASDLINRRVAVIVTPGSVAAALAAKAATTTIPIAFVIGVDPVQAGLVASLNRPGGNVTGISSMNTGLAAKQLGLLHQLLRRDARFAVLVNPGVRKPSRPARKRSCLQSGSPRRQCDGIYELRVRDRRKVARHPAGHRAAHEAHLDHL